ncbi:MAG: polymerase, sigma-24 subunit, subfamily, partial [Bryobacterales bacterium]|nr:polymerase, sigma-24 subunit, subfamily [Bryobacterales bacterium]
MIHITNGDSTIMGLRASGLRGDLLAWRDPLHDGPVPRCESLAQLSTIRARALADFGWGSYDDIRQDFAERDARLEASLSEDEVVLWFEHDLYDQLQLLQLLDWFSRQALGTTRLTLIQIDSHPEVKPFHGLGQL